MHKRMLFPLLCFLVVAFTHPVYAEPQPVAQVAQETVETLQQKVEDLEAELTRLRAQEEHYQFLKEEIGKYREFIEQERNELMLFQESLWTKFITILGILASVIGFMGFKTLADVKGEIKKRAEKSMEDIEKRTEQQLEELVQESVGYVRTKVDTLRQIIERETQYRSARVIAIGTEQDLESMGLEIQLLQEKGICVTKQPHPVCNLARQLERGEVDIVLYRYHPQESDQDPAFRQILETLCQSMRQVPLLVYAPSVHVVGGDKLALNDYPLHNFANTAATLVGNLYTLTHIFSKGVMKNDGPPVP
ncbi:hypothetical protein SY88_00400 [Clostridiales bacterium PH28_bin88]|nr:hypothetical protein SY88_00400 [Clostridiales bacterium PH28_bin88]